MASDTANTLSNVKHSSRSLDVFLYNYVYDVIHFNSLTQYNYALKSQVSLYAFTDY